MFLFAHGTADIVCLTKRETCQLPEDLHDLLLIDDAAIVTSRMWASCGVL